MNILFVCSRNQWRSPTAAKVWGRRSGVSTRSAGTSANARHTVNIADIQWADVICAMEKKHKQRLLAAFPRALGNARLYVLDIPDDYRFMDPELVEIVTDTVSPIVEEGGC